MGYGGPVSGPTLVLVEPDRTITFASIPSNNVLLDGVIGTATGGTVDANGKITATNGQIHDPSRGNKATLSVEKFPGINGIRLTVTGTQSLGGAPTLIPSYSVDATVPTASFLEYNKPASMADLVGTWDAQFVPAGQFSSVQYSYTITGSGAISGAATGTNLSGCSFNGTVLARSKNYFDVTYTWGPSTNPACANFTLAGATFAGKIFPSKDSSNRKGMYVLMYRTGSSGSTSWYAGPAR